MKNTATASVPAKDTPQSTPDPISPQEQQDAIRNRERIRQMYGRPIPEGRRQ